MPPPGHAALWSAGKDETVEVNQRALIDKILARYSGEHTIFRELLQNADDAGAQSVQVKFYTQAGVNAAERGEAGPLPDAEKDAIVRYVVCNDGIPFRPEDWHRLKKIAEGNPDEDRIGAFGVGFYSLWSVCEEPFVESGSKWMGFYWKDGKDQLVARSGDFPPEYKPSVSEPSHSGHPWTTFTMNLREPMPLEGPLEFARFLVTSLTFMRTIRHVQMVVDGIKVLEVRKDVKGQSVAPHLNLNTRSPSGMFNLYKVDATSMVITARVMKWLSATGTKPLPIPAPLARPAKAVGGFLTSFFGRSAVTAPSPEPPSSPMPAVVPTEVDVLAREIQTFQADVKVSVGAAFGRELERATKKSPPQRMPASLVFSREDETAKTADGSEASNKKAAVVFAGLCPPLDGEHSAKVFIGQPTGQTTGIGGHLAARFIPTVERESIDLVDRHVSQWNKELLWVGGYLSRLIYELEMVDLAKKWAATARTDTATRDKILARGQHALRFFSFRPTTPSALVGSEMESAFFSCAREPSSMPIISTGGILRVDKVRVPNATLLEFIPEMPVVTPAVMETASRMVNRLRERNLLQDIVFEDVVQQLNVRPLTEKEMMAALNWWQDIANTEVYKSNVNIRNRLLQAAILTTDQNKVISLGDVKTYVNPQSSSIPTDMPLPPDTIPFSVTKHLKMSTITQAFGWAELTVPLYVAYLTRPPLTGVKGTDPDTDMCVSPMFSERVLTMLGRAWQNMSAQRQAEVAALLKEVSCIPTRAGFKKPRESYFHANLLFDDLPTLAFPKTTNVRGGLEMMLLAIGVRKTVDLQLIFSRLVAGGGWSCIDLMKYLVSVKDTLSNEEWARLRQTAAFPLEQPRLKDGSKAVLVRRKPHELYEPTDAMRELGLPVLEWDEHKWKPGSEEARLLYHIGMKRFPPVDVLLGLAAGTPPMNEKAFAYLLNHINDHYAGFEPRQFSNVSFIPGTTATGNSILAKPGEVFTNPACKTLGFPVVRGIASLPENVAKLKIETDPPMNRLVLAFLAVPETDIARARSVFEYLASRMGTATLSALTPLAARAFIPVQEQKTEKGPGVVRLARPDEVFLSSVHTDSLYAWAFTFVDFGSSANMFLRNCGVKSEPSTKDIARLLLRSPERMLEQAGRERYLEQLRILATNINNFDSTILKAMRETPFLLASQLVLKEKHGKDSQDDFRRDWVLTSAGDTIIADSATLHTFFGEFVLTAPEEAVLESFYRALGAKALSACVSTEYVPNGIRPGTSSEVAASRAFILERLTIFLGSRRITDYSADWLAKGDNFTVSEANGILARYTYRDGRNVHQHVEKLYAMATRPLGGKAIALTVSVAMEPDFYDVANALCTVLLKQPKIDDVLMLESIMRTSLQSLKKRGFNVDRILNAHREEGLRKQAEAVKEREAREASKTAALAAAPLTPVEAARRLSIKGAGAPIPTAPEQAVTQPTHPAGGGLINALRRFRDGSVTPNSPSPAPAAASGPVTTGSPPSHGGGAGHRPRGGLQGSSTKRPSGMEQIRETARKAVAASKPGTGAMEIRSTRQNIVSPPESQQDYCDPSAEANIHMAYNPGPQSCQIWLPLDQKEFEGAQMATSQRFILNVLLPLAKVFELQPAVINVFWDREGPLIAFNRNGTIFCNGRYYEAWNDASSQRGQNRDALISWYFTLAHELAHNLESGHNASHEFYFSSIAEEYLIALGQLLSDAK
ncbi:uncharacterized protein CcaverHIS019_0502190 [Cutaneotrichosporon cavernicola]|uniref:Sacsin/Nov domain-containing protein n=1 Tax=Cutaneotrichosporon cavernicola TaxID=279322 RepID=A0AA48L610_9TREE|nr:uncharacterized protein CcaverHIS019_0502190 [Cutaneotrichosporon cavernicola]BEI92591.1 hypothetical protein CcaverHIS019_0502190 [Cutaneotrichosporon cavernicola]BEJ00366.1 hypothetical protein CcaverHIS631_0502230 [Cutaneotrichosporon cavernicola]BEJ08136.1 hypothetical protein CcaverHIS641_0502210 [Cutaneotrichosporon cavernicola]